MSDDKLCPFFKPDPTKYRTCVNVGWHHNGSYRCSCEGEMELCRFYETPEERNIRINKENNERTHNQLSYFTTDDLVSELLAREEIFQFPRYVTSRDVFGHRETFPGNKILFEKRGE